MKFSRNISITIICIILGIMLSWQYKSIESNKRVSASQTKNLYDLQKELLEEKKEQRESACQKRGIGKTVGAVYRCGGKQ